MDLKKYSTEELKEILSNFAKIRNEYNKRKKKDVKIKKDEIYYAKNNDMLMFIRIKYVDDSSFKYDYFEISAQDVDYLENLSDEFDFIRNNNFCKIDNFNESFSQLIKMFNEYVVKSNKLFNNFYSDCFQCIKNLKQ